jgi:elongator complex protein 3
MPKSYMHNEPACQRAERNFFDPYLQVASRMRVLADMGHVTDKVELIVLGGTWSDYSEAYQVWFMSKMFEALNDGGAQADVRRLALETAGCVSDADELAALVAPEQCAIDAGKMTYNQAREVLDRRLNHIYSDVSIEPLLHNAKGGVANAHAYDADDLNTELASSGDLDVRLIANFDSSDAECHNAYDLPQTLDEAWARLRELQAQNELCSHRNVGLVVETRPDLISQKSLFTLRRLGCTKVQIGIQSLNERILELNGRHVDVGQIERAFELLRLYGFKSHIHFMVNLLGATPEADKADFAQLVRDARFLPDEAKLYPCALVENSALMQRFDAGEWAPYSESELIDVLASDVLAAPSYLRISRMIRDISATDIVVGNKKTNLRQLVEQTIEQRCRQDAGAGNVVREMRMREIATSDVNVGDLHMDCVIYDTTVSREYFLQWVGEGDALAGFLRLSLPNQDAVERERAKAKAAARKDDVSKATEYKDDAWELAAEMDSEAATGIGAPSQPSGSFSLSELKRKPVGEAEGNLCGDNACEYRNPCSIFPIKLGEAMIREVHVYGRVAAIHKEGDSAQHAGLGRRLVERACEIAREAGYVRVNVISAVGTRDYYRGLGFKDNGLYQQRELAEL